MLPNELTLQKLAQVMEITPVKLTSLANGEGRIFKQTRLQWTGRKHRTIDPMYPHAKQVYRRLHRFIASRGWFHGIAHGGVQHRSCFTSAGVHCGAKYVWTRDVSDCFPSIKTEAMRAELVHLKFSDATADILASLFTHNGVVPQGSPLSNDAVNLYFLRFDRRISSYAGIRSSRVTRVTDDVVISSDDRDLGQQVANLTEDLLRERNLEVNLRKKDSQGFRAPHQVRLVHGINVGSRKGCSIETNQKQIGLSLSQSYLDACKSVTDSSLLPLAQKREVIHGWLHHFAQAAISPAKQIRQQMQAGDRIVTSRLKKLGITCKQNKWWILRGKEGRNVSREIARRWRKVRTADNQTNAGSFGSVIPISV